MSGENPAGGSRPLAAALARIVARRRQRLAGETLEPEALAAVEGSPAELQRNPENNRFLQALERRRGHGPAIIAEVKMGSPSLGSLMHRLDPLAQARLYGNRGAAAISVVVEPDFFYGSYELLERCRRVSGLPAVAKDFVVDPVQLHWARDAGADAVLLIAALYDPPRLLELAQYARSLGLVPLVECHDAEDLALLGDHPWELVGVNNRDLRTFEVDFSRSEALVPKLPEKAFKVAESGLSNAADIRRLLTAGFDAFLVGESLLLADDPGAQLRALLASREGKPR